MADRDNNNNNSENKEQLPDPIYVKHNDVIKTKIKEDYINEDEIEKAKEAWKNQASDFFVSEVGLGQHEIDQYFDIAF